MANEKEVKQAGATYQALIRMLQENDWHFERDDENLSIECSAKGDDLSMDITIRIDAERQLAILYSPMPFTVPENKRATLAVAVSVANYGLVDGSFDYDFLSGRILFRMTSSFLESLIDQQVLEYMLYVSCHTIDEYNDKFLVISQMDMSVDKMIAYLEGDDNND